MISNFKKTTITILLVLCMAVSVFAVNAFAEDTNSTSKNADSTSVNHTCERKVVKYTATQATKYIAGDNTYPELEGYLFAGWYNNEDCTKAGLVSGGTPSGEEAFALYIPEHVLSIQAQASANLMDEKQTNDGTGSLRFITSVDSLLYKQVGFEVYYTANGVTRKATSASNKVYSKLYEMDSEKVWEKTPSDTFCNLSKYFKICTLKNFTMQTYMETEFTVKPYWITMDGDKVYGVEATKKFSEGCLRDEVWVSSNDSMAADEPNYGSYDGPYKTLDYAITHVKDGGTVRVKDSLNVASDASWYPHGKSVTITGDGTNDDSTGETVELETLTFEAGSVRIMDAVTFKGINLTLSYSDGLNAIFAEGNHLKIAESVNLTSNGTQLQIFGGSSKNVVKETNLELYAGTYNRIYGGGYGDVSGNTKVTIGGSVNKNARWEVHDDRTNCVFGGCYGATVHGNTNVTVESGAKANYIFGAGETTNSKVLGDTNVVFEGQAYAIYGGSAQGTNADTHVTMNGGTIYQIFGGCESNSMVGDTDVQVLGGKVCRRIYGGCYNEHTDSWASENHVTGCTSVSIGTDTDVNLAMNDIRQDNSLCALTRDGNLHEGETGTFIFNDFTNCSTNIKKIGHDTITTGLGVSTKTHHYQVNATSGGTVYSAGNCIRIVPEGKNAATVTIGGVEKFYTSEKESYYPLPAGHDASVPILVTFGDAKETVSTDYKAKIGSAYYLTLEEAIKAADKMKDADIETINGSTESVAKITVLPTENGTVTSSCKNCVAGETVTFDVAPDEGYNLVSLVVNGNDTETTLNDTIAYTDATYTFTTPADVSADYTVEAVFKKKVFKDNTGWDLSAQHSANNSYDGKIVVPSDCKNDQGNSTWLELSEMYTDIDITLSAKSFIEDKTKESSICVQLAFDNGKNVRFRLIYKNNSGGIQSMNGSYYVWGYPGSNSMSPEEITAYKTGDGVDYRLVRLGSMLYFYIGERQVCPPVDLTNSELDGTGENTGITADMPATVSIRCDGNVGAAVEHSFIIKDEVEKGTLTIKDSENGKVAASKTDYFIGDKITLTPEPNDAYNCASLMVDGKEVELTDGAYTFTATDINYEVEAVFAPKIFKDSVTTWNLSKQYKKTTVGGTTYDGCVSYPNANGGNSTWLDLYGQYGDIDLTIRVRDYVADYAGKCEGLRQLVQFTFTNGKKASFSITYTGPENEPDKWSYKLQPMGDSIFGWTDFKALTDEQIASYQDEDGIEFRVLRYGTMVNLYLDGELVCEGLDLTSKDSGVTEDMLADVTIRNYDNATENLVIPFTISTDVDRVSVNIEETTNGAFTTPKKNYLKGETVVVTAAGDDGYYYDSLKVNDDYVELNDDGTYSFTADEDAYTITGSFAESIFVESAYWNLKKQHDGVISVPRDADRGKRLDTKNSIYKDVELTVRDYTPDDKNFKLEVRFKFENSEEWKFRLENCENSEKIYRIQPMTCTFTGWWDSYNFTPEETDAIKGEDGIKFRAAIVGTYAKIYLDGKEVYSLDISKDKNGNVSNAANETAQISLWWYGSIEYDVKLPFKLSDKPTTATVNIDKNITNGTITTDKDLTTESYIVDEKVTLTVAGEDGYYYDSLIVNDKEVAVDNNGIYTFIAQETNTITASFAESIFVENVYWNLKKQHDGVISVPKDADRGKRLDTKNSIYKDVELTVRDYTPDDKNFKLEVRFKFENSEEWKFRLENCENSEKIYRIQPMTCTFTGWWDSYNFTPEETEAIKSEDGIKFRAAIVGTYAKVYLDGEEVYSLDISKDKSGNTSNASNETAQVSLWWYGSTGYDVEMPFRLGGELASATVNIDDTISNGTITKHKDSYIVGEKVTLTATGKEGYYCNSLAVNGTEVQPNWDSTYTFTAAETNNVTATFAEGAFKDNNSSWNLSRQNYGVLVPLYADGVNSGWLDAEGNFTELNMTVKDYLGKANSGEPKKEFSVVGKFTFDNGKWAAIRIINEQSTYKITQYGGTDALTSWNPIYTWNQIEEQKLLGEDTNQKLAKIETDGIEFKLVRSGASIEIWLAGTLLETLEFDGITADNTVTKASIRHYGNPTTDTTTYEVEVPFSLVKVDPVALTLIKNEHGVVTTDVDNYFVGDTVIATVSPGARLCM